MSSPEGVRTALQGRRIVGADVAAPARIVPGSAEPLLGHFAEQLVLLAALERRDRVQQGMARPLFGRSPEVARLPTQSQDPGPQGR